MRTASLSFPLIGVVLLAAACGAKKGENGAPKHQSALGPSLYGNSPHPHSGILVLVDQLYKNGEGKVGNTGVDLLRMRAWKRNPDSEFASHTPGDAPDFDQVTVELWFKLEGETEQRYRKLSGLRLEDNGWLFPQETLGGVDADLDETMPLTTFQHSAQRAFVLGELPARFTFNRATNIILESQQPNRAVQQNVLAAYEMGFGRDRELARSPAFSSIKREVFAANANLLGAAEATRTVWKKNERVDGSYAMKAPMACVVETRNGGNSGNGGFNAPTVIYKDIELGEVLHSASGDIAAEHGANPGANCVGPNCKKFTAMDPTADDELWVKSSEAFFITGINLNQGARTLRVTKKVLSPFYMNRQLPSSQGTSEIRLSGLETLIRHCNDEARKNAQSVGSNELLNAKGPHNIMNTIGFSLIANAKADAGKIDASKAAATGVFQTPLIRFCDAMPDSQSSSASLNTTYASLKATNPVIEAAPGCDSTYNSGTFAPQYQGQALGTVLDKLVAPGTWSAERNAQTGPRLKASALAADRPLYLQQLDGQSEVK